MVWVASHPSLCSTPQSRGGQGVRGPRQGRLVSVLGLMCLSQHAICHAHQKLHNPLARLPVLRKQGRWDQQGVRVRHFVPCSPSPPWISLHSLSPLSGA